VRGETVLDVGCGLGKWAMLLRSNYYDAGLPAPPTVDGIDAWEPMVQACRETGLYRNVWQQEMPGQLDGQWDTVIAVEIIEHVPQDRVDAVFDALESVAKQRIIFSTPNWPAYRPGLKTSLGFSEHEAHLSYVSREEFRRRGYRVVGSGLRMNPTSRFGRLIRHTRFVDPLESLPRLVPRIGDLIVAYKDR
jgi:2-polyprenyl-3-methyl-5-hydroxy-6-metoxy-1,4-benzoquinol methylase